MGNTIRITFALGLLASPLTAQDPTQLEQSQDPTLVDSILGELEGLQSPAEYGSQNSFVGVHGFFDLVYRNGENQGSGFDLHHANLLLDVAVSQDTDVRLEFEWEHGGDSVEADQVYLEYHPGSDNLSILMGRFYAPFGMERHVWYPPASRTVTRPLAFREIVPGNWYETGAMVKWHADGDKPLYQIEAAITNGLGASMATDVRDARQSRNNNQNLMISGRAGVNVKSVSGGVSWANGKYDDDSQNSFSYLGIDLGATWEDWELIAEWVTSTVDEPSAPGGSFDRHGWYMQAFYSLYAEPEELGVFGRFDRLDPDNSTRDADDRSATSVGLRWVPTPRVTFKLEYQKVNFLAAGPWPGEDLIAIQVVFDF
jgi:hypothetical protein